MNSKRLLTGPIMLIFLLAAACGHEPAEDRASVMQGPVLEHIELGQVQKVSVVSSRSMSGTVIARSSAHVSPRIMAQVERIHAREGQRVRQGELLVELDDREFRSRLEQAEGALGQATSQLDFAALTRQRYQALLEGKAVSQQEYDGVAAQEDTAREAVKRAEAAVSEARTYLGFTRILSPVDGIVVKKHLDPGTMAAPGAPVLTVEEARFQVEVPLNSSRSHATETGQRLRVEVEPAGFTGEVRVSEIVPSVDPMSRTFTVRANLPDVAGLRSGQYARVTVPDEAHEVLTLPESAVVRRGQMDGVYHISGDGTARFRFVKTGARLGGGRIEVLSGLNEGDVFVASDTGRVSEGARVKQEQSQ